MGRIMDFLTLLSNSVGFISLGITLVVAFFAVKSGKMQSANQAQGSAIAAMRSELETLRERIEDAEKENSRLEQIIDTICSALKIRGMVITVQGEMVHIQDQNGSTTTKITKHA